MSYADAINMINYAHDLQIELQTKLVVLFLVFAYCLAMIYISTRMKTDNFYQIFLKYVVFRFMTAPYVFFFPLLMMFAYRGVSLEQIFIPLLAIYPILFVIIQVLATIYGAEWVLSFFGVPSFAQHFNKWKFKRGR